jgi:prefoldin subunit 5
MTGTESSSTSAAVAIIDLRVEALEERLRDVQERLKELRQIREAVIRDLGGAPAGSARATSRGD